MLVFSFLELMLKITIQQLILKMLTTTTIYLKIHKLGQLGLPGQSKDPLAGLMVVQSVGLQSTEELPSPRFMVQKQHLGVNLGLALQKLVINSCYKYSCFQNLYFCRLLLTSWVTLLGCHMTSQIPPRHQDLIIMVKVVLQLMVL